MALKWQAVGITGAMLYAAAYALKLSDVGELRHFKPSDFGPWFPLIDSNLLSKLDQYADYLQGDVIISPAPGALGRIGNDDQESQHFPSPFVLAVDTMAPGWSIREQYDAAQAVGFHGIGLYPDWKPHAGAHLDMRSDRTAANPALWSGYRAANGKQKYAGISRALA